MSPSAKEEKTSSIVVLAEYDGEAMKRRGKQSRMPALNGNGREDGWVVRGCARLDDGGSVRSALSSLLLLFRVSSSCGVE